MLMCNFFGNGIWNNGGHFYLFIMILLLCARWAEQFLVILTAADSFREMKGSGLGGYCVNRLSLHPSANGLNEGLVI